MRYFKSQDDRIWTIRLDDELANTAGFPRRVGWEAVLFEAQASGSSQRITFRPCGWLAQAGADELAKALQEAAAVRTHWEAPPMPPMV